jgi:hypothetical protein
VAPLVGATSFAVSPGALWVGCLVLGLVSAAGQYRLLGALDRRLTRQQDQHSAGRAVALQSGS